MFLKYLAMYFCCFSVSFALTVESKFNYFHIDPKSPQDIYYEIKRNGPYLEHIKGAAAGVHESRVDFLSKLKFTQLEDRCNVSFGVPILYSTITVYRLLKSQSEYSPEIVAAYERSYQNTLNHEIKHRKLWDKGILRAEGEIRGLLHNNRDDCETLKERIKEIYLRIEKETRSDNLRFDCEEYGFSSNFKWCEPYRARNRLSHDNATFSGSHQSTKTKTEKLRSADEPCNGERIEPFKGIFYCVTGEYKVNP